MKKIIIALLLSTMPVHAQDRSGYDCSVVEGKVVCLHPLDPVPLYAEPVKHHHRLKRILIITAAAAGTTAVAYAASRGGHAATTDAVVHQPQILAPR